ncbi:hypothetical protein FPV67DRAFT_1549364 [Lyophyllum atratum]|nr:hypothetical protein FPV67DRAFT_1549364 [Lyophyllum atratum]
MNHKGVPNDRRSRLQIARSLQGQLMFYEGEWGSRILQDSVEGVYVFLDDDGSNPPREALPTSVVTILARCYSPSCGEGPECYASRCPQKHGPNINSHKIDADPDVISCFRGGVKDRATPRRGPWQTQAIMAPGTANSFADIDLHGLPLPHNILPLRVTIPNSSCQSQRHALDRGCRYFGSQRYI